jgi:putative iron-regulated protein
MKLGLILHDPEEEHDCFSDNTHNSHYYDQMGIRNVYTGHYTADRRLDVVAGPSIADARQGRRSCTRRRNPSSKLDADGRRQGGDEGQGRRSVDGL